MAATVAQTPEYVLDVCYKLVASGAGHAQKELVRRLETELPAVIDEYNTRNNLTSGDAIEQPTGFKIAPNVPADDDINQLLVGLSVATETQGLGGAFKNEVTVNVYSINHRVEAARQVSNHWDRADLIRSVLLQYLEGVINPADRVCWRVLEPLGIEMLPIGGEEYSGVVASFRMVIPPSIG